MRVVLIGAELEESLTLRSIHAALTKDGHECRLVAFDTAAQLDSVAGATLEARPDVVGLSMVFTRRAQEFVLLASLLRERGYSGRIVAGGHFAVLHSALLLRDAQGIDFVLAGEGEEALVALLDALDAPMDVPGLSYRDANGRIHSNQPRPPPDDLDARPWPTRPEAFEEYLGLPIANLRRSEARAFVSGPPRAWLTRWPPSTTDGQCASSTSTTTTSSAKTARRTSRDSRSSADASPAAASGALESR